jgi:hypothetical protein
MNLEAFLKEKTHKKAAAFFLTYYIAIRSKSLSDALNKCFLTF